MKKINTSSQYVTIYDDINGKFIRKSKKRKDLSLYLRTIPQNKMLKFLDNTKIKHPKLIRNRISYIDEEYIDGKVLTSSFDRKALMGLLCNTIYDMYNLDCTNIQKYKKWNNNSEYLYYNVDILAKEVKKSKNVSKLEAIGLNLENVLSFKNPILDDQRKLILIHGEFYHNNIIEKNLEYFLVDWEQAAYGDLAYELAIHFILENYTLEEQGIVIDRLSKALGLNQTNLVRDIKVYINFELTRKCFIQFTKVLDLKNKKMEYESLLKEMYNYYFQLQNPKVYEELKSIVEN